MFIFGLTGPGLVGVFAGPLARLKQAYWPGFGEAKSEISPNFNLFRFLDFKTV